MNVRQSKNTATDFTTVRDSNVASVPPRCARGCTLSAVTRDAIPLSRKRFGHDRADCALRSHRQRVNGEQAQRHSVMDQPANTQTRHRVRRLI
jgi:hypothetical protein